MAHLLGPARARSRSPEFSLGFINESNTFTMLSIFDFKSPSREIPGLCANPCVMS